MLYVATRGVLRPLTRAIWRPTITGTENLPRSGGVIIASNHLSFVDSVVIPLCSPRKVVFLAKSDYFTGTGVKGAAQRLWFETMGMVPVDRGHARSAQESLETALEVLRGGEAFGIYPEGTRSRDGRLYRGRTGVAWLALTAGVPVVPCALTGTEKLQPIGSNRLHVVKVTVQFGKPIDFVTKYAGVPAGRARRAVTDEVMDAIHAMSGQERVDAYNERPDAGAAHI